MSSDKFALQRFTITVGLNNQNCNFSQLFVFFLPDVRGFICTHCMRPQCARVSPHQGRKIVLNSNVYPLNKTSILFMVLGDKEKCQQMLYIVQQMVYGLMRGNLTILIVKCNKRFILLKLLLEPSLKNKMHTAITGKYIWFFSFIELKSRVFGNSCFVIEQNSFPLCFFYLAYAGMSECSKCLIALMQEKSLWGSSLFLWVSGLAEKCKISSPFPFHLGGSWGVPWNMSIPQTLLSCKLNILWCEWSSLLQCSCWCHKFNVHGVVIFTIWNFAKTSFFSPQTMIIACMFFFLFLHNLPKSSELWEWQSCWSFSLKFELLI